MLVPPFRSRRRGRRASAVARLLVVAARAAGSTNLESPPPIIAAILAAVRGFGEDVGVAPKKAYVSLRGSKQFALLQPSTASRLDVGINLKGREPTERLEPSGSFNSTVSHRVRVGSPAEVDAELLGWLREAYEAA